MNLIKLFKTFLIDQFVFKFGGDSGGGGGQPTQSTSYNTNVPEYAKPYVTNMLESTQKQLFNTTPGPEGSTQITGFKEYKPYSSNVNDYFAGFSPMQQQAQRGIAGLQLPGQFADASTMAQQAGIAGLNSQYNPMSSGYNRVFGAQTDAAQMGYAPMSQAATGSAQNMAAATGSAQDMQAAQMGNSPEAQAAAMQAAQLNNAPLAQASQFGGPRDVNAQNVGTQEYTGGNVSKYMNPYLQSALDPQLAEVQRQYDITGTQQKSGAAKAGAFGGSREALMAAENQRNAGIAKNQIIGQGYNQAFQNAQQQFNAQQQADLQAQQANQGANLQAGLANQNMGYNTGLQNAQFQQQANLANQGLMGQYGLQQGQFGQAANQANQQAQMQANLANQALAGQYGLQQGQFGQAANQANQAARNQFGMANLANQQTANQANQAAQNQFGMANLSNQQQSGLANQALMGQYGLQQGQFGQAANLANQQSRNQANLANQQAQLQAQQQNIGQQQFGANYRLQGLQQANQAAQNLGALGAQQLQSQQGIYTAQNAMGAQQQALEQQKINQAIQDYATQQQYPLMQLGFMSNMLRGLPMQATTTQAYQAQPSALNQGLGVLAGAAGAKQAGLFKEGGTVRGLAEGGVTRYANTGMVQGNPDSGVVRGIQAKLQMMSPEQLQQVAKTSPSEEIRTMALQMLQEYKVREQAEQQAKNSIMQDQKAMPTPVSQGVGLPAAPAPSLDGMASGGIIAFADEGQVSLDPEAEARLRQQYITAAQKQREALGIDTSQTPRKEYYAKEAEDIARTKEENKGKYLMDLGLGIAGGTGNIIPVAARAASAAGVAAESRKESTRSREGQLAKGLADIAEGERLIKLGDVTAGNAMYEKGAERINKLEVAMARPKDSNQKDYANAYVEAARAKGDKREQAILYAEGVKEYIKDLQAARMAGVNVQGQVAGTTAFTANVSVEDKARDNVDSSLSKNYNSPENREIRRLQKEDKLKGTNTAIEFKNNLYTQEANRLRQQGGGTQTSAANTNKAGTAANPIVLK
jgi:hypothetical protein